MSIPLGEPPVLVALAGPNGAGKSTFYHAHLQTSGLPLVNADVLARELSAHPYEAAKLADALRRRLLAQRESFVFETVFSDPVGDKLAFLHQAKTARYNVLLCFIGLPSPKICAERVAMRVTQGGHDVPSEKLEARFPRSLANLKAALRTLPRVMVFDNADLTRPFRRVAVFEAGTPVLLARPLPRWLSKLLEPKNQR